MQQATPLQDINVCACDQSSLLHACVSWDRKCLAARALNLLGNGLQALLPPRHKGNVVPLMGEATSDAGPCTCDMKRPRI